MKVVIVGAGQAASQVSQSLRKFGFDGDISIHGSEPYLPYQRPPLSKAYLKSQTTEKRLYFRPRAFYEDQSIDMHLSSAIDRIDRDAQQVVCLGGARHDYDRLVICTGSIPIRVPVPGNELAGIFVLRSLDDANSIRDALATPKRVAVIGGGYIGLEAASAARQLGHEVVVIERLPRLLSRVTSPVVSDFFAKYHHQNGVDIRLDVGVEEVLGDNEVAGLKLDNGQEIAADIVLVGIGVRPADKLVAASGIECSDGVLVDPETCQSSDPIVYAAGDCARQDYGKGHTLRLESVHNALIQADRIAAHIVGNDPPPFDPPWFWSDQYDRKIQTVGLFGGHDSHIVRGSVSDGVFSVLYFLNDELIAVDSVNDPVTFLTVKKILKQRIVVKKSQTEEVEDLRSLTR